MLAFDRYHDWQPEMFFGQWVETLIDPAMKAIQKAKWKPSASSEPGTKCKSHRQRYHARFRF